MKKIIKKAIRVFVLVTIIAIIFTVIVYNHTDKIGENLTILAEDTQTADCILVLGAGVVNGQPSWSLANRLDRALEIYNLGLTK